MTNDNRKGGTCRHTPYDDREYRLKASSRRRRRAGGTLFALLAVLAAAIVSFGVWSYFFDR